jgi:hypothetical protein
MASENLPKSEKNFREAIGYRLSQGTATAGAGEGKGMQRCEMAAQA